MIAIEGVFSKKNLEQAFSHFDSKNHSEKKANVSPYREMWELNGEQHWIPESGWCMQPIGGIIV